MTAMNLYKDSPMSSTVVQAVDDAFRGDERVSFRWFKTKAREAARDALTEKLLKIAMDNLLRTCTSFPEYIHKACLTYYSQGFFE